MREYLNGFKSGRFPEPAYDPLPRNYDKWLVEQKFLKAALGVNIAKRISATGWADRSRNFGTMLMNEYRKLCTSHMEVNYLIDLYNNAEHNGDMNKALSVRALKLLHEQHRIDLPVNWQEIHTSQDDSAGSTTSSIPSPTSVPRLQGQLRPLKILATENWRA